MDNSELSSLQEEDFNFRYYSLESSNFYHYGLNRDISSNWARLSRNDPSLESLHIYNFTLKDHIILDIATHIAKNTYVRKLYMIKCNISPKGAIAIAEALEKNTSIQHVSLANNNIGPDGANAFWKMLKASNNNRPMKTISLIGNNIGNEGLLGLINGPDEVCRNIPENLFLSNNNLTDMGAIISLVEKHHQIRHLFLDGNDGLSPNENDVLRFHLELNQSGRRAFLKDMMAPVSLWGHALTKLSPSQMHYFLKAKPELFKPENAVL
mmetsp:Transcript_2498/g.3496  ORF Transcript_2498/g.3496 Transcript_2498/m.3496 type:complete len:267 (+) Transcript_2498:242-1042(+)